MNESDYPKGKIGEAIQFISLEIKDFEDEYANKTRKEYQEDRKLQKLIDRTVENILTALIEICITFLVEEGISIENYSDALRICGNFFNLSDQEQESLVKLNFQRNLLSHRYLDQRWQAVQKYSQQNILIKKFIEMILAKEKEKQGKTE